MRDTRKDAAYFTGLIEELADALEETQAAMDDGEFTSPSERVDVAQRLFQLSIMRAVAAYSSGASLAALRPHVEAILPYREQLTAMADKLPSNHQFYRRAFEKLGDCQDAVGSPSINRYIYTFWWLALLHAADVDGEHIAQALNIINERGKDALFDRVAVALGDTSRSIGTYLYHPDVYQDLLTALNAPTQVEQVELIHRFISTWYSNLSEADWHDTHDIDCEFEYTDYYTGYWCFEAALVASVLGISAEQLRGHPMMPVDAVNPV